jgi:hypothetical protein
MVVLNFTLTPEAASKIHDLLICLGKFSDTVAIEARRERVGSHHCPLWHQSSHLCHSSSLLLLSILQNLPTLQSPSMESSSSPPMNVYQATADPMAASRVACIPRLYYLSSKVDYMIR